MKTPTVQEMAATIGQVVSAQLVPGLWFDLKILDARLVFGRYEWKVTPVAGSGEAWIDSKRAQLKLEDIL